LRIDIFFQQANGNLYLACLATIERCLNPDIETINGR
jgi:hypothetical protein